MNYLSHGIGLGIAALLLALLGLTRLLIPQVDSVEYEVREVDIAALPEPPPPPPEEPPPEQPPPPPALTQIDDIPDPTRVPVPKVDVPLQLDAPVDPFFSEVAPSPLPKPSVSRPVAATPSRKPSRPKAPRAVAKSHYSISELDGKPRLLRHGSAAFPSSLARRGVSRGTVTFEVELTPRGRVEVRRVVSSTHSELIGPATRIARSARFTTPTRRGEPVKAIMRWPITIRK
jgi:protein TonB